MCKVFSIDGHGVDIDKGRIDHCASKGLNVSRPEDLSSTEFDIVISTSVIEHVIDLNAYFEYISSRLSSGGIFIFNGLSPKIIPVEQKKGKYKNVHPIEHLSLFTKSALLQITQKHGFTPVPRATLFQAMVKNPLKAFSLLPYFLLNSTLFWKGNFNAIMVKQ